ncbi:MAG: DsbA family protein [Nitriliruptorales bacterium]|nr:DsbA family protein [Nitriliruptorales bacterium]
MAGIDAKAAEAAVKAELIYIGDPMCSWCWGFAPVLDALDARYELPLRTIVGGLRPGPAAEPLGGRLRAFLQHHWEEIARLTGQPFDLSGLDRPGWIYDTWPADLAVVAGRIIDEERVLAWFSRLQRAFYAEAADVTDHTVLVALADEFGLDGFADVFDDPTTAEITRQDFRRSRELGISGFPSLLFRDEEIVAPVAYGYTELEGLTRTLDRYFVKRWGEDVASGLLCSMDDPLNC